MEKSTVFFSFSLNRGLFVVLVFTHCAIPSDSVNFFGAIGLVRSREGKDQATKKRKVRCHMFKMFCSHVFASWRIIISFSVPFYMLKSFSFFQYFFFLYEVRLVFQSNKVSLCFLTQSFSPLNFYFVLHLLHVLEHCTTYWIFTVYIIRLFNQSICPDLIKCSILIMYVRNLCKVLSNKAAPKCVLAKNKNYEHET